VTDGLDPIAVRVDEERSVVVLVIVRARTGRTVVRNAQCRGPPAWASAVSTIERKVTPGSPGRPYRMRVSERRSAATPRAPNTAS